MRGGLKPMRERVPSTLPRVGAQSSIKLTSANSPRSLTTSVGDALVRACVRFARDKEYDQIILWTHTVLDAARRIYARHGFKCGATDVRYEFGETLQGETRQLMPIA